MDLLERIKKFNLEWVKNGHRKGDNTNNVSATVSVQPEEWEMVGKWMWGNRNTFNGLAVLPYDNGSYVQAPFENITEEEYNLLVASINKIDLTKVVEMEDNTDLQNELACSAGGCEII
jgi:ribonucleoside-diphosphate reductase alpha chain